MQINIIITISLICYKSKVSFVSWSLRNWPQGNVLFPDLWHAHQYDRNGNRKNSMWISLKDNELFPRTSTGQTRSCPTQIWKTYTVSEPYFEPDLELYWLYLFNLFTFGPYHNSGWFQASQEPLEIYFRQLASDSEMFTGWPQLELRLPNLEVHQTSWNVFECKLKNERNNSCEIVLKEQAEKHLLCKINGLGSMRKLTTGSGASSSLHITQGTPVPNFTAIFAAQVI